MKNMWIRKVTGTMNQGTQLPDGTTFPLWDDQTVYSRVYHVGNRHPHAADTNPGTAEKPFKTIGRAAELLKPGEKVVIHEGVYRECVVPRCGGTGPDCMIAYEAAPGEDVLISGAAEWVPSARPSSGWQIAADTGPVWMADLPAEMFVGYNPFLARNIYDAFISYHNLDDVPKYLLRRGGVFVDGRPLRQVNTYAELAHAAGVFWVEEPGLRLHFRLFDDAEPKSARFEVTVKEQLFAPALRGLGYIRISGLRFERVADGVPVPQRAMVSTSRGHHWIIEDNRIRWANACGLDVGNQDWKADMPAQFGSHIVRGNRISDCGVCGIAGCRYVDYTLVENNIIERVGGLGFELMWEVAGLKFHRAANVLIRNNLFCDMDRAVGVWLDFLNSNCRITANVFRNIVSCHGAAFIELTEEMNVVDHNIFWDVRISPAFGDNARNGTAMNADNSNNTITAYNFFGKSEGFAVMMNALQEEKRKGECHRNRILNNVIFSCSRRIFLGNSHSNQSDHNLFDAADAVAIFEIQESSTEPKPLLPEWQEELGLDRNSVETDMQAELDVEAGELRFSCCNLPAAGAAVLELGETGMATGLGPFNAGQCEQLRSGETVVLKLPVPNDKTRFHPRENTVKTA